MINLIIFGSSGHAGVVIDIFKKINKYNIFGLVDDYKDPGTEVYGYPILGAVSDIDYIIEKTKCNVGFIAIGDNCSRLNIYRKILTENKKFSFISAIDPSAIIMGSANIGIGVTIMPGVVISSNCTINNFCIVNTSVSVDHDSIIGEFSSLAPGVVTGGNVIIGNLVTVSIGAILSRKVKLGNSAIIGAGSVVLSDMPEGVLAYGAPAKVIRKLSNEELASYDR